MYFVNEIMYEIFAQWKKKEKKRKTEVTINNCVIRFKMTVSQQILDST